MNTTWNIFDLIEYYRSMKGNSAGGNLHIILDDGNLDDDDITFCHSFAFVRRDFMGMFICDALLEIDKDSRQRMYEDDWKPSPVKPIDLNIHIFPGDDLSGFKSPDE